MDIKMKEGIYLCKVSGLRYCNWMVLQWSYGNWMQYYRYYGNPDIEGWCGLDKNLKVLEYTLIEETKDSENNNSEE